MTTANNTQDLVVGMQQPQGGTSVDDTQDFIVGMQQATTAFPILNLTQDVIIAMIPGRIQNSPPAFFNLQKLILTVKEASMPVRGRNQ